MPAREKFVSVFFCVSVNGAIVGPQNVSMDVLQERGSGSTSRRPWKRS